MSTVSPYTVANHSVQDVAKLAARRGWDVEAIVRSTGLSPALLAEDSAPVTAEQARALIHLMLSATGDELLGLGAAPVPPGTYRMTGYALLGAATSLGQALNLFRQFRRATPGIPALSATSRDGITTLTIDIGKVIRPLDLLVDVLLIATHHTLGWAIGERIPLRRVEVPYRQQPYMNVFDARLGAPVRFGAPAPALLFDSGVLDSPIMRSHKDLDTFLRNAPAQIMADRDYGTSVAERVRQILQHHPAGTWPSSEEAAAQLAMSPQTVRRKLRHEGTSWTQIREDVLRDMAIARLTNGKETVADLSTRLGFSEPSAFIRAFRRWTGNPPGAYRSTQTTETTYDD